jgi:CDK inhibitor PHO81
VDIAVQLHVAFPNRAIRDSNGLGHCLDLNAYVESILLALYRTAASHSRRRISFVSFSPSVCIALNWKQPNCKYSLRSPTYLTLFMSSDPVFFASHCGLPEQERSKWRPPRPEPETDRRCTSVAAAVEFAHANNLLGVFLNANLLVRAIY